MNDTDRTPPAGRTTLLRRRRREATRHRRHATGALLVVALQALGAASPTLADSPSPSDEAAGRQSAATGLPGYERVRVDAAHRPKRLDGAFWYPAELDGRRATIGADAVFAGEPVGEGATPSAPPAEGRALVLLSHGSGSNVDNMGWLAAALVGQGAVVAGVNHPGSTSNDSSPRRTVRVHERTADVSALLDTLLADPAFAPLIDPERVSIVGFSLGGFVALHSVGARLEHDAFERYCADIAADEVDCRFYARGGVDIAALDADTFERGARDRRIVRAVSIDPAFAHALDDESLAAIDVPVQLINLGTRETRWSAVELSAEADDVAGKIPGARYAEEAAANHYTFLGRCTAIAPLLLAEEGEDTICDDPAGVDRAETHARLAALIAPFAVAAD